MSGSAPVAVDKVRGKDASPALVLTALMLVISSFQLNATMLSPSIGDMAHRLHTNPGVIGWSSTVFLSVAAALAVFFPPFADKIGRKRVLIVSVSVMIFGTLLILFTASPLWLMIGRALQGFCGATFALGNLTLRAILDPKRYGFYIGLVAAINSGVAGIDTLVGGMLTDAFGYKAVVLCILAVELIALLTLLAWVPETRVTAVANMDWLGAIALTLALWSFNMGVTFGFSELGWSSMWTMAMFVIGIASAFAFVAVEKNHRDPLVPLVELKKRSTWGLLGTTLFTMASAFATLLYLIPAISQDPAGFGMSSTVSALMYLTPFSLAGWLISPFVGKYAPLVGYRLLLRIGLFGSTVLLALFVFTGYHDKWIVFAIALCLGISYTAMSNTTINAMGVLYSSETRPGVLPGLNSAAFNLGAGLGIGVMASTVAQAAATGGSGYSTAMIIGVGCGLIALLFSLVLPGKEDSEEKI
ncbi:MFS transporter [Corynebacterium sp. H128]|uniref:MFS transporter n=1 Tax=unclassified Corynebacterium TaxID=2624378 RepID=UPI00309FD931